MATSFVEFKKFGFWATDYGLTEWQNFLGAEIDKLPEKPPWMEEYRHHLYEQNYMAGTAAMDAGLDDFVTDDNRKATLLDLIRQTLTRIESYNGTINTNKLVEMGLGPEKPYTTWLAETTTTDRIINIGRAFQNLLLGEIKTSAATSPLMDSQKT